ncbi:ZnMc domain-containing protein [Mycena sanguinolenta]|uniref:ZnMc domain-containing protein n=1 Tax=Mycena sanguinolenta TaxID=230812 RepID=A0A8H6XHR2_9AGAR|nr:ZnMc domain-containing protein [Mycena sanguinolenta]
MSTQPSPAPPPGPTGQTTAPDTAQTLPATTGAASSTTQPPVPTDVVPPKTLGMANPADVSPTASPAAPPDTSDPAPTVPPPASAPAALSADPSAPAVSGASTGTTTAGTAPGVVPPSNGSTTATAAPPVGTADSLISDSSPLGPAPLASESTLNPVLSVPSTDNFKPPTASPGTGSTTTPVPPVNPASDTTASVPAPANQPSTGSAISVVPNNPPPVVTGTTNIAALIPSPGTADALTSGTAPVSATTPSTSKLTPIAPSIISPPITTNITSGTVLSSTVPVIALSAAVGTANGITGDALRTAPPPVPTPVETVPGAVQPSTSGPTPLPTSAVGFVPPTAAAMPKALASTKLVATASTPTSATGVVPTCTIKWPHNWLNMLSTTEAICDAIGLPMSQAAPALLYKLQLFWDNGSVITYSFIGATDAQQTMFNTQLNFRSDMANYRFVQVAQGGTVRVSFDPSAGSWTYVGRAALDAPSSEATTNLVLDPDSYSLTPSQIALCIHMIYHILGMMHEHPGPKSGGPATLNEAAVCSCYQQSFGWDAQICKSQIINVYNSDGLSNYAAVNAVSVMRYPIPAALTVENIDVGLPDIHDQGLSIMDATYVMVNYPLPELPQPNPPLNEYFAYLVDAPTTQLMTDALNQGNITKMRAILHAFLLSGRLGAPTPSDEPAHGVDPAGPPVKEDGWCGVSDPSDQEHFARLQSDDVAPSGVLRGVVKNFPPLFGGLFGPSDAPRNLLKELWDPYTEITYGFLNPLGATEYRRKRIQNALAWYTRNTSLTFRYVEGIDTWNFGDPKRPNLEILNNCNMRIWFGEATDNIVTKDQKQRTVGWARFGINQRTATASDELVNAGVGRWSSVYLGDQARDSDQLDQDALKASNNTLYHDHALGLHHEHAIKNSGVKAPSENDLVGSSFDGKSMMLYSGLEYKKPSNPEERTPQNPYPSPTDLAVLRLLYPDREYTFASGLDEMQFEAEETAEFLRLRNAAIGPGPHHQITPANLTKLRDELVKNLNARRRLAKHANDTRVANPSVDIETRTQREARLGAAALSDKVYGIVPANPNPWEQEFPEVDEDGGGGLLIPFKPGGAQSKPDGPQFGLDLSNSAGAAPTVQAPGFLQELVTHLKEFFLPGGQQMFVLQFPGRFLDQAAYAWDTASAGIYGQFIKPTAVNEAEFRLVDQLYDVAPNVGGPNGTNLSIIYQQLLNNLLPKYIDNGLAQQQDLIRDWLIKDVPMTPWIADIMARQQLREKSLAQEIATSSATISASADNLNTAPPNGVMFSIANKPSGESLNRIELSELLMNEYLYAKQDWEIERDNLIMQATQADVGSPEAQKALNDLTRRLAHITDTRQAQLAAKYADAVVRGYSHTIRQYMGYLDIASPAEALQDAKDSLREAAMSSLDGSMSIYPVQLTPLDWFAGLSTSFTLEDLTQNPELVALQMGAKGDPTALKEQVLGAQNAVDDAQSALAQNFSNNVIEMAKTCLDAAGVVSIPTLAGKLKVAETALSALPPLMEKLESAQTDLTKASRALSQMLAAQALAEATDTKQQQQQLMLQIQSLSADLKELQTRWQVLTSTSSGVNPPTGVDHSADKLPTGPIALPPESSSGGSRWQEISFTSTKKSRESSSTSDSSASSEHWNCNIWFASGSGGSTEATATVTSGTTISDDTIDLALRVTLVTVDRGGWFQPQFFKQSQTFYKVNPTVTWTNATRETMSQILRGELPATGLMPGFPVGFLIAKDIVVRISHGTSAVADTKATDMASAASSGGILCFSYSNSSSSNSTSTTSSFQSYSNGFIVKIPGPQILGYMVQVTDPDQTELMPATLPKNFFIPDAEYNKVVEGGDGPAHVIHPVPPAPTITQEKLREVLDKMLNEKIGEIFEEVQHAAGSTST